MISTVILLIILSSLIDSAGQLLFKTGVNSIPKRTFGNIRDFFLFLGQILKNMKILLGMASYVIDLILWLIILSLAELSFVFPISSLNYIFVILGSKIILKEKVGFIRWAGSLLILVGIILIGSS